jgi:hypothetical protein
MTNDAIPQIETRLEPELYGDLSASVTGDAG